MAAVHVHQRSGTDAAATGGTGGLLLHGRCSPPATIDVMGVRIVPHAVRNLLRRGGQCRGLLHAGASQNAVMQAGIRRRKIHRSIAISCSVVWGIGTYKAAPARMHPPPSTRR